MDFLPVFLNLKGRRALIIGGGVIAARKATLVHAAGPAITVVSPELNPAMQELAARCDFAVIKREFRETDLDGFALVVAATDDAGVNAAVYKLSLIHI